MLSLTTHSDKWLHAFAGNVFQYPLSAKPTRTPRVRAAPDQIQTKGFPSEKRAGAITSHPRLSPPAASIAPPELLQDGLRPLVGPCPDPPAPHGKRASRGRPFLFGTLWVLGRFSCGKSPVTHCSQNHYSMILETTPAPTVRPPSRMAKRRPSSIAIGAISSTENFRLSPGITISVPSGRVTVPVTSVVRK